MERGSRRWARSVAAVAGALVFGLAAVVGAGATTRTTSHRSADDVVFITHGFVSVTDSAAMRSLVLNNSPVGVNLQPLGNPAIITARLAAEANGKATTSLVSTIPDVFAQLQKQNMLADLSDVAAKLKKDGVAIPDNLLALGRANGKTYMIPWVQTTHLTIANKKALPYLPKGANINNLTYTQFFQWAKNLKEKTGQPMLGFAGGPVGSQGPYWFMEYLVPSFCGGLVTTFKEPCSVRAWAYAKALWKYVHPQTAAYTTMDQPLLSGEVWLAWDSVANMRQATLQRPNDFVVFPNPRGAKGLAFMRPVFGLAVPKTAPDPAGAKKVIEYLMTLNAQARMPAASGWFPVLPGQLSKRVPSGLRAINNSLKIEQLSPVGKPATNPAGIGDQAFNFYKVFYDTYVSILNKGDNIEAVLNAQAQVLQGIFDKTGAFCFPPDKPTTTKCQVS